MRWIWGGHEGGTIRLEYNINIGKRLEGVFHYRDTPIYTNDIRYRHKK